MKIESPDGKALNLSREITIFTGSMRIQRALKSFGIGVGLAIVSIAIPGLHFFLVPGFLIFAFYSAYLRYNEIGSLQLSGAQCPNCMKSLSEKTLNIKNFPARVYCYDCRTQLRISHLP